MASTSPFHLHHLSSTHHHPLPRSLPLRLKPPSFSISSSHPNHNPHTVTTTTTSNPLAPLLKPACIALTAAALLLSSFRRPSLAAPHPPTPATQTLEDKEDSLEEHLDQNPDDVGALRTLMELKARASKYPEAIDALDRILILQPDDPDLPLLRAHFLAHSGDPRSARIAFEELLNKDPFRVEAYHGLVMAAAASLSEHAGEGAEELRKVMERVEGAMERCKKEKRREQLRNLKLLIAQVKVVQGKYDEALRVYQDLVREEPRDFRPYLCQGIVYSVLRRNDEAEMQFEKYRRLVPRGHPYAKYFDDTVVATKVFGGVAGKKASTLR